ENVVGKEFMLATIRSYTQQITTVPQAINIDGGSAMRGGQSN
ncbi:unnamed protein product, partial [marine sediment metagenome]